MSLELSSILDTSHLFVLTLENRHLTITQPVLLQKHISLTIINPPTSFNSGEGHQYRKNLTGYEDKNKTDKLAAFNHRSVFNY